MVLVYTKSAGANLSGSGRRKPKQVQVTPAKYHYGYLLRAFTTCAEPAKEISYVSTRSGKLQTLICLCMRRLSAPFDKYSDYFPNIFTTGRFFRPAQR